VEMFEPNSGTYLRQLGTTGRGDPVEAVQLVLGCKLQQLCGGLIHLEAEPQHIQQRTLCLQGGVQGEVNISQGFNRFKSR
jgi:hypothetical protein